MKKRLLSILMVLLMVFALAACGQEPSEPETEGAYDELIGKIRAEIEADNLDESQLEGMYSLYVGLEHLGDEKLSAAGYTIEDINGDGTPELIVGMVGGNVLFNLYTLSEGEPVLVFDSFARNSYSLMEDGKFSYHGSSSAASSAFGVFSLPAGGTELECEDFWFSDIKPGTDMEIGFYHNTAGVWEVESSEELEISEEEFWEMGGKAGPLKAIELTPFA